MKRTLSFIIVAVMVLMAVCPTVLAENKNIFKVDFNTAVYGDNNIPNGWSTHEYDSGISMFLVENDDTKGKCVKISSGSENDARLCYELAVEPNTRYRIKCEAKAVNVKDGAGVCISVLGTYAVSDGLHGNTDWQELELVGKTDANQKSMTISLALGGYSATSSGNALFSSVSVETLTDEYAGEVKEFSYPQNNSKANNDSETNPYLKEGRVPYLGYIILIAIVSAIAFTFIYGRSIKPKNVISNPDNGRNNITEVICFLVIALIFRFILSFVFVGHPTDIACFKGWSNLVYEKGFSNFYTSGVFTDYPPGYMYVLWVVGFIADIFGLKSGAGFTLLVKLPAIIADIASAYMVYRIARRMNLSHNKSLVLMVVMALNPMMAFVSGAWGQIDSILTLLLIAVCLCFTNKKIILAGAVYGLAILVKPQALIAGPVLAVAYFALIFEKDSEEKIKNPILKILLAVASAVAVIFVLSLPFKGSQDLFWIVDKYVSTSTSYPYATVEAYNLFGLLGGNWEKVETAVPIIGISYKLLGTILIALSIVFAMYMYINARKSNKKGALLLSMAFAYSAVFSLGHYMHERYLYPAIVLTLFAFLYYNDRRLFKCFAIQTIGMLINVLAVFAISAGNEFRGDEYNAVVYVGSAINVLSFIYFTYVCTDIMLCKRISPAYEGNRKEKQLPPEEQEKVKEQEKQSKLESIFAPRDTKLNLTKKDIFICLALTVVYGFIALTNLGTTQAPVTQWAANSADEEIVFDFGGTVNIAEIRAFGGIARNGVLKFTDDAGNEYSHKQEYTQMYRWYKLLDANTKIQTSKLKLEVSRGSALYNEIAFIDNDGKYIPVKIISGDESALLLIDEPEQVPANPSNMNGMYFDELYHARTAYEHLHNLEPYEITHPPLGKIITMVGVAIFGMNAFGWRVMPALFGIFMVPIMYMFGKRLFKKSEYALLMAGLFAFDFMHFVQTRISTIDVYGVFFIILMFYYMYQYYNMSFFADGLKKTLKPLALAGLFFGLGISSKWICFYAGGGLAVILLISLIKRYKEYKFVMKEGDEEQKKIVRKYWINVIKTLLWCCVFYLAVPAVIYVASYLPYMIFENNYSLSVVIENQKYMFNYHSQLVSTHPYESEWWKWIVMMRPMWYYKGAFASSGNGQSISAFGNPAVWWGCLIAVIALIGTVANNKKKTNNVTTIAFIGIIANLLPWVFISRSTYIYHYFATVPFIIICGVEMIKNLDEKYPKFKWIKWVWLALTIALFVVFYPVLTGIEVPVTYLNSLELFKSWVFMN